MDRKPETWSELLQHQAAKFPERTALVFHNEGSTFDCSATPAVHAELATGVGRNSIPGQVVSSETNPAGAIDAITYGQLHERAMAIGAWLSGQADPGDRALLVAMPGLEFVSAWFGCLYAGVLPVPATYPKPRRPLPRLATMARDCRPRLVLTTRETLGMIRLEEQDEVISRLSWQPTDALWAKNGEIGQAGSSSTEWQPVQRTIDDLAFLQYTSGSTSEPRGVMVSHRNLLDNVEMICRGFGLSKSGEDGQDECGVFWLPAYHDMGLIGGILTPLYIGGTSHLLAPATFLRRPLRWLEAISATGATISGGPNFAYELCVAKTTPEQRKSLDLSRWRLAFCGAEPIDAATLNAFSQAFAPARFNREAFYPCYGLAEATLMVSGGQQPTGPRVLEVDRHSLAGGRVTPVATGSGRQAGRALVSCGRCFEGMDLRIIDPKRLVVSPSGTVGEIWLRGESVARGYWQLEKMTEEVFAGRVASSPGSDDADRMHGEGCDGAGCDGAGCDGAVGDGEDSFLRTGDLGFLHDGHLYVTGRLKDVIIIRGRNHYPQDIERTAQQAHEAVDLGAAFVVDDVSETNALASGRRKQRAEMSGRARAGLGGDLDRLFSANGDGRERLVVVHQIHREHRRGDLEIVIRAIRRAIVEEHELDPDAILLIRPVSLPLTSSGKVQRLLCRDQMMAGALPIQTGWVNPQASIGSFSDLAADDLWDDGATGRLSSERPDFSGIAKRGDLEELGQAIEVWLLAWISKRTGIAQVADLAGRSFAELGVDSMTAIELSQELEDSLQVKIPPTAAWDHPTPASLSHCLAELYLERV